MLLRQVYMSLTLLVAAALATSRRDGIPLSELRRDELGVPFGHDITIACGNVAVDWPEPDAQETSDAEDEVMFDVAGSVLPNPDRMSTVRRGLTRHVGITMHRH